MRSILLAENQVLCDGWPICSRSSSIFKSCDHNGTTYPSQFLSENQIRVLFLINWSNQYSDCIVFRVYLSMWKSKTCMHKTWVGHRKSFLQTSNVKASEFVPVPGIQWGKNPLFLRLWFSNIDFIHNSLSFGWFHPIDIDWFNRLAC